MTQDNGWVEQVYTLANVGQHGDAIDLIYDKVEEILVEDLDKVNMLFGVLNPARLFAEELLALLIVTLGAKARLPNRAHFIDRSRSILGNEEGTSRVGVASRCFTLWVGCPIFEVGMVSIKHNGREIEVDFLPYQSLYLPNSLREIPWWTNLNLHENWLRSDGLRFTRGIIKTKKLLTVEQQDNLRKNYLRVSAQYGTAYGFPKNLQAKQALQSTNYIGEVDIEASNFSLAKMFEILDRAIPVPRPSFMPGQVWLTTDMTLEMVTQTTVSGNLVYPTSEDPCYDLRTEVHKNLMDAVALMYGPSSYGMNIPWVSMDAWW